jgi:hypothetical protein
MFDYDTLVGIEELEENYRIRLSDVEIVLRLKSNREAKPT